MKIELSKVRVKIRRKPPSTRRYDSFVAYKLYIDDQLVYDGANPGNKAVSKRRLTRIAKKRWNIDLNGLEVKDLGTETRNFYS